MNFLNKIIFFIFFYLFTTFFAILSIPLVLFPRKYISYSLVIWSNFLNSLLYFLFKIEYKIYGKISLQCHFFFLREKFWPIWKILAILGISGQFGNFGPIWEILANLENSGQFGKFWPI